MVIYLVDRLQNLAHYGLPGWLRIPVRCCPSLQDRSRFPATKNRIGFRASSCLYCKVIISRAVFSADNEAAGFAQKPTLSRWSRTLQMFPFRLVITTTVLCHLLLVHR